MSNDEIIALYNAYRDACDMRDPSMETIQDDRLMELIEAAKKKDSSLIEWPRPYLTAAIHLLLTRDGQPTGNMSGGLFTPSQAGD